jgi:hypothetical protein
MQNDSSKAKTIVTSISEQKYVEKPTGKVNEMQSIYRGI